MIHLISQVTFIFLTQIYCNMNFITSSSNFIARFSWHFEINCFWRTVFCSTQKMHISECVRKSSPKELRILLKCRETCEKVLAAFYSSKILVFHDFKDSWQLYFKKINFLTKAKRCLLCWILLIQNYQINWQFWQTKSNFPKKVNPLNYLIQTYILLRTWHLLSMYFTGVSC